MHFSCSNSRGNGNFNNFSSFASINFNLSKSKLSDLVTWEPKLQLKQPLLNLHPSLIIEALNANRLIVHFMESDATSEQISASEIPNLDVERVSSLVKLGCQVSSEEIKDEIYCQLMKQTTRNFNRTSCLRGYQLILSCLAGFAPSQKLEPLLQYHLQVGCLGGALLSRRIVRLAESCIRALKMIKILGSRTWGLTRSEIITIISESNGLSIKVWFSKSQTIDIMVDSWTTVKELTAAVCDKLGIDCSSIMTLCLTSTSSDGQFEANSASCRGVLNTAFNHLHRHYVKLKPRASDLVIKWQLDSPFGRRKGTETLNLSARVERALDSCLQVHVLGQLEIPRGFYLNTSEHGTEQIHAARRMPKFDLRLCLSSTFHLMKRTKKPSIPFKAADEVVLKMQLVIWIFPQRGFYESSKTEMKTSMTDHCKLIQRDYEEVKVYHDKWAEKPIAIFDESSTRLFYECHIAEGEASMRNRICWPSNGAARKVLYAQLTDVTADRRQVPVEDIEILRMTALILAEHQANTGCQSKCFSVHNMKEIARNSLEKALPTKLLNMASSNRADAVNMIESRSQYLVNQVIRREFHNENEFEIDEFDVNHTACQIRANSNLKRSFVRNALKTSNNLKPNHIPNWSDDSLWKDFLSTVIVRLWLLLLNLTAEECREQYLSSARRSIGYGAVNFYPSAIRINMMTLQEECEFTGPTGVVKIDIENSGSNDDDGYYTSSKIPIWTTLQTEYSCNTRSRQSSDSTNLTRVTTTIQVDINFREVLVTEHSITETDILEDKTRIKITSNIKSKKVIIKIMIDEILSWGYNENTVILKFKKRGYGHEASYYSDDDENDTNDNNIDHDQDETRHQELQNQEKRIHLADEEDKGDIKKCHLLDVCISEAVSPVSLVSTASGCPINLRCYDYVRVRDSGSQESVKCDDNAIESKKRSKSCNISSHFLENDEEVLDRKSVGEKDDLQSLDRSDSLGTNSSKTESVPDREADSLNSIFVTASSSDVNSASNRRSVGERTISAQKSSTQLKVSSRGTESIAMDLSYGAEVVEVLNLYNIERIYEGGIKKDTS